MIVHKICSTVCMRAAHLASVGESVMFVLLFDCYAVKLFLLNNHEQCNNQTHKYKPVIYHGQGARAHCEGLAAGEVSKALHGYVSGHLILFSENMMANVLE
jgi:hypothetical protein